VSSLHGESRIAKLSYVAGRVKRNVTVWRPSVSLSHLFSNLNSQRGADWTRLTRGQHATQPAYISIRVLRTFSHATATTKCRAWVMWTEYELFPALFVIHRENSAKFSYLCAISRLQKSCPSSSSKLDNWNRRTSTDYQVHCRQYTV